MNITQSKHWKWLPGMVIRLRDSQTRVRDADDPGWWGHSGTGLAYETDPDDPATQGCIEFGILAPLGIWIHREASGIYVVTSCADADHLPEVAACDNLRTTTRAAVYLAIFAVLGGES